VDQPSILVENRRVTHDELVADCLAKPGAVEDEPWEGDVVAKVDGTIPAEELRELVDESYDAIAAKLPRRLSP
jgi:predicted DNA-binding protein (MmcQ/YjbR family)